MLLVGQACCHCLHPHVRVLHLHVLIWHYTLLKLLVLGILPLRVKHQHVQILVIHVHILVEWLHWILHHHTLKLVHVICIVHIELGWKEHLSILSIGWSFTHRFLIYGSWVPQFVISMSVGALICVSALSVEIKVSALNSFVVLRKGVLFVLQGISVFILINKVLVWTTIVTYCLWLPYSSSSSLVVIFPSSLTPSRPSVILLVSSSYSVHTLIWASSVVGFWHLVAVLVLNRLLSEIQLLSLNRIVWFPEFGISMSKMAFYS